MVEDVANQYFISRSPVNIFHKLIKYLTVYEPSNGGNCPYCRKNLKLLSHNVVGYGYATSCPFCHKRIYGSYDAETGGIGWTTKHPLKIMLICIVGAIVLSAIIIIFLIKTGYIDKIT